MDRRALAEIIGPVMTAPAFTARERALSDQIGGDNFMGVAMTITQGALARRESRGGHFRTDYLSQTTTVHTRLNIDQPQFAKEA